jgi:phospholipid/cholesterol/gamma-HCH transport system substrate-binding protein
MVTMGGSPDRDGDSGSGLRTTLRVAAVGAVIAAVLVVGYVLLTEPGGYNVSARFINAGQLVEGNEVRIGGVPVGTVSGLELAENGEAVVEMEIEGDYTPLPRGTHAVVRITSLSGIANRYIDLQQPDGASEEEGTFEDGTTIPSEQTTASVEIDQLFSTFGPRTRRSLQKVLKGSARMWEGREAEAREGYRYLNPALSSSRRLFSELAADTVLLERFVTDSARLVTALAERRSDLAGLVGNLNATTRAAAADTAALGEVLQRLPGVMRQANTTFVNTRATLDEVDPLVDAAEPVAERLQEFLPQLRGFAADAEPTVRDLSRTIRAPEDDNDLIDLLRTFPPLTHVAMDTRRVNGAPRPGAFPQTADALREAAPIVAFGRPYTPDLWGWFDDFSHSGAYDALGGFSRSQTYFNFLSVSAAGGAPEIVDLGERGSNLLDVARTGQFKRCPGHAEAPAPDGSNVYTQAEREALDCLEEDRATGP